MEQNSAKFSFNFEKKTINKTVTSFMEKSVLTKKIVSVKWHKGKN